MFTKKYIIIFFGLSLSIKIVNLTYIYIFTCFFIGLHTLFFFLETNLTYIHLFHWTLHGLFFYFFVFVGNIHTHHTDINFIEKHHDALLPNFNELRPNDQTLALATLASLLEELDGRESDVTTEPESPCMWFLK